MAKQSGGYLGGFTGKLGTAVGYMWNGKWCVRAHNSQVRNPRTEAQVEHRELFKQEVQLAASMRPAIVKSMTSLAREEGMTSYNLFVSVNQHAFSSVEGRLEVDYSALRVSMGSVSQVELREMLWDDDNVLSVGFKPGGGRSLDYVYLYVYVPGREQGIISAPVYRYQKHVAMMLSSYFTGYEAHVYLLTMSEDGRWGESLYCGAIQQGEEAEEEDVAVGTRRAVSAEDEAVSVNEDVVTAKNASVCSGHGTPCPYGTGPAGNQDDREDERRR